MSGSFLREAGTLFDVEVPRLNDPSHVDPQPGIALEAEPTVPLSTYKALPLPTGEAPAPGQYVVHDTAALRLPHLLDVLAHGVSFVFQEAGRDRIIAFLFDPKDSPLDSVVRGLSGAPSGSC